jgi:hypothetical protein
LDNYQRILLPKDRSLRRNFRNTRKKGLNLKFQENYDIPKEYLVTFSGLRFVQFDSGINVDERMIICFDYSLRLYFR